MNLTDMKQNKVVSGPVHCPICTHNVPAHIVVAPRKVYAKPGQRCPRCGASLDAAFVLAQLDRAA